MVCNFNFYVLDGLHFEFSLSVVKVVKFVIFYHLITLNLSIYVVSETYMTTIKKDYPFLQNFARDAVA